MFSQDDTFKNGILIVTGSTPRAEQADRPLAYTLQQQIEGILKTRNIDLPVLVLGDLWYLNAQDMHRTPTITIGGPGVNAVSANFYDKLQNLLVIDNTLLIQMDPLFADLRVSIWGYDHAATCDALDLFIHKKYLKQFLNAVTANKSG